MISLTHRQAGFHADIRQRHIQLRRPFLPQVSRFLSSTSLLLNFLNRHILDLIGLEHPTRESRTQAYIYAFLAFVCSVGKAQADVQHLWFGRRGASRMRSELMASIYDKALKRKDFSGIVNKDKKEEAPKEPVSNGVETKESKRTSSSWLSVTASDVVIFVLFRPGESEEERR
jgi:ABC-type multidrug transport system fused ATPase/permease subunit